jgi:hypothetical protein
VNLARGLRRLLAALDSAQLACARSQAARFEESRGPKPFVEAHVGHATILNWWSWLNLATKKKTLNHEGHEVSRRAFCGSIAFVYLLGWLQTDSLQMGENSYDSTNSALRWLRKACRNISSLNESWLRSRSSRASSVSPHPLCRSRSLSRSESSAVRGCGATRNSG